MMRVLHRLWCAGRRTSLLLILLCSLVVGPWYGSVSAVRSSAQAHDLAGTLAFGGLTRTYLLHLPPAAIGARPLPLLLLLHRANGDAGEMNDLTHMNALADRDGFLVVYPNGYQEGWADGRGSSYADQQHVDDVGFLSALVAMLRQRYAIDSRRIAVAGLSNGGFMAQRLACERADLFAAAISVAATLPAALAATCSPQRAIPMLFFEGTADPFVPYDGGEIPGDDTPLLSSGATARRWAQLDGCAQDPGTAGEPIVVPDGTAAVRTRYGRCDDHAEVVRYTILNGGHTWPGGSQYLPISEVGKTSRALDASALIWAFVSSHPCRCTP